MKRIERSMRRRKQGSGEKRIVGVVAKGKELGSEGLLPLFSFSFSHPHLLVNMVHSQPAPSVRIVLATFTSLFFQHLYPRSSNPPMPNLRCISLLLT